MDQTAPDSGAQLGAQAAEYGQPSMAEMTAELAIVHRALDRHKVSQNALARRCNLNPGYLSRVLKGSCPVTFAIFRAVWDMTRDPDLIGLLDGDGARVIVVDKDTSHALYAAHHFASRAVLRVMGSPPFGELEDARRAKADADAFAGVSKCCPPNRLDVMG